jgi:TonB family protein
MLVWGQRDIDAERLPNLGIETTGIYPPRHVLAHTLNLKHRKEPEYSNQAIQARIEGIVILSARIDGEGAPRDLKVVKPLGHGLDEKAIEAAAGWRFERPLLNGDDSPIPLTFEVQFRLPRSPEAKP